MKFLISLVCIALILSSCGDQEKNPLLEETSPPETEVLITEFDTLSDTSSAHIALGFNATIPVTGRYQVAIKGSGNPGVVWVEDYIKNADKRTYNITGSLEIGANGTAHVEGSPLAQGTHEMAIHLDSSITNVTSIAFELMLPHINTPDTLTQLMSGDSLQLVWGDEFNDAGAPDTSKWSYKVGNWGWGNNELQYYESFDTATAYINNGALHIRGYKDQKGNWHSARLSTQGKQTFLYGKLEIRAKVPTTRGTWSAGWLLGDAYRDEISWPYCGEIDVMECVGYEINDTTGAGLNHASCHTPAFYFKKGNHLTNQIAVDAMNTTFHTYSVEWYPHEVKCFVDGLHYYTYDKTANELEWPFSTPQNIILNLAIGGGWGGAKGLDPALNDETLIIDYVRVYEKR